MATTTTTNKETTRTETVDATDKTYSVIMQILYFLLAIIEGVLGLRFLLLLAGANTAAPFVQFIYNFSELFLLPFRFIFPQTQAGEYVIEWSIFVAMIVYALAVELIKRVVLIGYSTEKE